LAVTGLEPIKLLHTKVPKFAFDSHLTFTYFANLNLLQISLFAPSKALLAMRL